MGGWRGTLGGFRTFLPRGHVVDLAMGIVVGPAFGNVAQALVWDVITPLLSMVGVAVSSTRPGMAPSCARRFGRLDQHVREPCRGARSGVIPPT